MAFPGLKWEIHEVGLSVVIAIVAVTWVVEEMVTKSLGLEEFEVPVKHPDEGTQ